MNGPGNRNPGNILNRLQEEARKKSDFISTGDLIVIKVLNNLPPSVGGYFLKLMGALRYKPKAFGK